MKIHDHAEYVSPGHPDRLADAIANAIVNRVQFQSPQPPSPVRSLAGVEVAIHESTVFIDGRVAVQPWPDPIYNVPIDFRDIARDAFRDAGYDKTWAPAPRSLKIIVRVCEEELSEEEASIRPYSDDQNIVIGYAVARPETNFTPPAHWLAHHLGQTLWQFRKTAADRFGPDFKILVDLTDEGDAVTWRKLVLSIQHARGVTMEDQHRTLFPVITAALEAAEAQGLKGIASSFSQSHLHLNGAGDFVIGGPRGDNGLSGKKLVVDHYGPSVPIGGGALSGKDSWKVDRCGALRARQLAKRLVVSGHHEARVVLGWAPGEDIPSLRDAFVRQNPDDPWSEVPTSRLPAPRWFAIESIVQDLELTGIDWSALPLVGTFIDPREPWERV
jgi:S-adenosylmethionine synthetase